MALAPLSEGRVYLSQHVKVSLRQGLVSLYQFVYGIELIPHGRLVLELLQKLPALSNITVLQVDAGGLGVEVFSDLAHAELALRGAQLSLFERRTHGCLLRQSEVPVQYQHHSVPFF